MATPDQDAQARANGFNSYEEMMLWAKQRAAKHTGTIQGKPGAPVPQDQPTQAPAQQQNNAMGWGIAPLFQYIQRAMAGGK